MTGDGSRPEQLREKMSQLIRYEMKGMPTASLARIKELNEETRRATIETVPDGTTETDVPVAAPYATDGAGDITPLNPEVNDDPVRGLVLYLHHPLDDQIGSDGFTFDGRREHDEEHAVFLPAMFWFGGETVPEHDPAERTIQSDDGNTIRMDKESVSVENTFGAFARAVANPEPEFEDAPELGEGFKADRNEDEDFQQFDDDSAVATENADPVYTEWPEGEDGRSWVEAGHAEDERDLSITRRGTAFEHGPGSEVATGPLNDGERRSLDGPHQHFHPVYHSDGTVSLAGPPLSFREFIAWMTDADKRTALTNGDQYADAQQYALNYLEWLEEKVGRSIDPTDESDWPDPQPMPTVVENVGFSPSIGFDLSVEVPTAEATASCHPPSITTFQNDQE